MSKRKNRSAAPNLPQETLERARRQAAIERGELPPEREPEPAPEPVKEEAKKPAAAPQPTLYRSVSATRRREVTSARSTSRRLRASQAPTPRDRQGELDAETIAEMLENPTRFVSEDELKRSYSYVLADLRSMGMLAAGLLVLLIVLAQILPR